MFTLKYLIQLFALIGVIISMCACPISEATTYSVLIFIMATIIDHIITMNIIGGGRR